jgi:hypothetical protein
MWLDISMYDALLFEMLQSLQHLFEDEREFDFRQRALTLTQVVQRAHIHVLECDIDMLIIEVRSSEADRMRIRLEGESAQLLRQLFTFVFFVNADGFHGE